MELLEFIAVGIASGWIMGKIRHGRGYGLLGNLLVGALGSLIGWFLMGFMKMTANTLLGKIAMAVAGAVVFFLLVGLVRGERTKNSRKDDDEE